MKTRIEKIENDEIIIVDESMPSEEIEDFFTYVNGLSYFRELNKDLDGDSNIIFANNFEPEVIEQQTLIGTTVQKLIKDHFNEEYKITNAKIYLNSYGDSEYVLSDSDPYTIVVLYYSNFKWDHKWGGETLFYKNCDTVAITALVPGRIVIFPAKLEYSNTVPTRICRIPKYTLKFIYQKKI